MLINRGCLDDRLFPYEISFGSASFKNYIVMWRIVPYPVVSVESDKAYSRPEITIIVGVEGLLD